MVNPTNDNTLPPNNPPSNEFWHAIAGMYGVLRNGITQVRLEPEWGDEIIGTVTYDPTDDRFLLVNLDADTLPQNTLPAVDAVIDPLRSGPGAGLPAAADGQRYLILNDIGNDDNPQPPTSWGSLVARANDVIQWVAIEGIWAVVFEAAFAEEPQFVTNITTSIQYRWTGSNSTAEWIKSYEGLYPGGQWSLVF